jgi:hypothetical protein
MGTLSLAGTGPREAVETPVGKLRASPDDARQLRTCLGHVRPGETLFVFPYQAMWYFLSGARNPTGYAFLQPGMMSREDERAAADQLKANPPAYMLYADLPPEFYLRTWPSSNPAKLRMPAIEEFIHDHYAAVPDAAVDVAEFRLMRASFARRDGELKFAAAR